MTPTTLPIPMYISASSPRRPWRLYKLLSRLQVELRRMGDHRWAELSNRGPASE
jgi:hypothetical protein